MHYTFLNHPIFDYTRYKHEFISPPIYGMMQLATPRQFMKQVYLSHFKHILPPVKGNQNEINSWILRSHQRSAQLMEKSADWEKLQKYFISSDSINTRYSFSRDLNRDWEDCNIYRLIPESPKGMDIQKRADYFQLQALQSFETLYPTHSVLPDHLIHVTCTGYVSPSAPQRLFANLKHSPAITHAYHMGCYASLPALRTAKSLVKSDDFQVVDVVHTEMCSLHMASHIHTAEQMIVQSLFADGVIKYQLSNRKPDSGFEVLLVHEKLVADSAQDMTWIPSGHGMMMSLTREVPTKIALGLSDFIEEVCAKLSMNWEELKSNSLFAIHPGGPKILDLAAELLQADPEQLKASKEILREHGNMSSATLPHIWERILTEKTDREFVLSLAFGPGLTIIGSVMRRVST
jgi:predicted naringenin-chalcone synthase